MKHISLYFQSELTLEDSDQFLRSFGYPTVIRTIDTSHFKPVTEIKEITRINSHPALYIKLDRFSATKERKILTTIHDYNSPVLILLVYSQPDKLDQDNLKILSSPRGYLIHLKQIGKQLVFRRHLIQDYNTSSVTQQQLTYLQYSKQLTDREMMKKIDMAFDIDAVTTSFFQDFKAIHTKLKIELEPENSGDIHNLSLQFLNNLLFQQLITDYSSQFDDSAITSVFRIWRDSDLSKINISDDLYNHIHTDMFAKYPFTIVENSIIDQVIAVDPEMLGKIFESLISEYERGKSGIFYTPKIEVIFICQLGLYRYLEEKELVERQQLQHLIFNSGDRSQYIPDSASCQLLIDQLMDLKIIDPACGGGVFLVTMAQLLFDIMIALDPEQPVVMVKQHILASIVHGIDIKDWAVDMTRLRLLLWYLKDYQLSNNNNNSQIPVLNLHVGDALLEDNSAIFDQQGYDIVIGNPPYIRSEEIAPPNHKGSDKKTNKAAIKAYKSQITERMHQYFANYHHDKKQDYFIYFIYHGLHILRNGGVLIYVTSDSWLNMTYGFNLQHFLTTSTKLEDVIINLSERVFDAEVNTCILSCKKIDHGSNQHLTRFVSLLSNPYQTFINSSFALSILNAESDFKTEDVRVRLRSQVTLHNSSGFDILDPSPDNEFVDFSDFTGNKWGNLLFRTPERFVELIRKLSTDTIDFIELQDIDNLIISYAEKTGFTKFFFPSQEMINQYGISRKYLHLSLKSPRGFHHLKTSLVDKTKKGNLLLIFPDGEKLPDTDSQYIVMAESDPSFHNGSPPQDRPSLQNQSTKPWYCLDLQTPPPRIMVPRFHFDHYRAIYNDAEAYASDAFYYIEVENYSDTKIKALCAILNSNFTGINSELFGRIEGAGVLQVLKWELAKFMIIDPDTFSSDQINQLAQLFEQLDQVSKADHPEQYRDIRLTIDRTLLDFLNIEDSDQIVVELADFYEELVDYRLASGRSK